jgi:type IV secretion system protein TrbD
MTGPTAHAQAGHVPGFEVPIHGSLGSPILLAGALSI